MSDTRDVCQNRRSAHTLISAGQYMIKWVEPALENQKSQIGRIGESCRGFILSIMHDSDSARSCVDDTTDVTCTLMFLVAPLLHKSHYDASPASGGKTSGHWSSWDSVFESRDDDPMGRRLIWKSNHVEEDTLQNEFCGSFFLSFIITFDSKLCQMVR